MTVAEFIEILAKLPQDAKISHINETNLLCVTPKNAKSINDDHYVDLPN